MIDQIFEDIKEQYSKDEIHAQIQEMKYDYVDEDWENEFGDFEEAYIEVGRCAAESAVVNSLVRAAGAEWGMDEDDLDTHCAVFDMVIEEFDIEQES